MASAPTKKDQQAQQERSRILNQLAKNKWWQQPYDPRSLQDGDMVKFTGKFPPRQTVDRSRTGEFCEKYDIEELDDDYVELFPQAGFQLEVEGNKGFYASDLYCRLGDSEQVIKLSAEDANDFLDYPYVSKDNVQVVKRKVDVEPDTPTNTQTLQALFDRPEMQDPRLLPAYRLVVEAFQKNEVANLDQLVELMERAAPYVEWQRKFNPEDDYTYNLNKGGTIQGLRQWMDEVEDANIDLETNQMKWKTEPIFTQGKYEIAPLDLDDFIRHGEIMDHCIRFHDETAEESIQPFHAMQEKGHWELFSLRDDRGRPHATICVVRENGVWNVVENKGNGQAGLNPEAEIEGKSVEYAKAVTAWLSDAQERGIVVDRSTENTYHTPRHPEFGLEKYGYVVDAFEGYGLITEKQCWNYFDSEAMEDHDREGTITASTLDELESYTNVLVKTPEQFYDGEGKIDFEDGRIWYEPANDFNVTESDIETVFRELLWQNTGKSDSEYYLSAMDTLIAHCEQAEKSLDRDAVLKKLCKNVLVEIEQAGLMSDDDIDRIETFREREYMRRLQESLGDEEHRAYIDDTTSRLHYMSEQSFDLKLPNARTEGAHDYKNKDTFYDQMQKLWDPYNEKITLALAEIETDIQMPLITPVLDGLEDLHPEEALRTAIETKPQVNAETGEIEIVPRHQIRDWKPTHNVDGPKL